MLRALLGRRAAAERLVVANALGLVSADAAVLSVVSRDQAG